MSPEVAIASHACAHIGAVQVPVFSGFAAPAVAQRLQDSEAKVAITTTVSSRRGREVPMLAILEEARREAPSLEHVVVAPWDELTADCPGLTESLAVDSEHPYLLTYTSGTTGKPKGVVHVHGGFLVSIAREACYQADARPGDVIHFATDMGWIMGPWTVVGGGAMGATIVFAEGAPDWPHDRLWRLIEQERVSILGCSPTLIRALIPHGDPQADLSSLRLMLTTGEPWNPDPYMWLHERVGGGRCPIINASGGTEVGACFLSPSVAMPIKACSLGFAALGNGHGRASTTRACSLVGTGEVGELVCRKPFPGMTRGFWRDRERFLDTYWRRFPGIWTHGDWASVDADGYWFLHGRSDDTLNIAGKRIGPAEIESAVVAHPGRGRGGGGRHPARGQGRGDLGVLRAHARAPRLGRARRRAARARRGRPRQGVRARAHRLRLGPAEDALGEDRAPRRARDGARPRIPATCPRSRTPRCSRRSPRMSDPAEVVRGLWDRFEARDWDAAAELLAEDVVVDWPQTRERMRGRENVIAVNRNYPEGWTIRVLRVLQEGDVAVSEVAVDHVDHGTFHAASFFDVRDGQIVRGDRVLGRPADGRPARLARRGSSGIERESSTRFSTDRLKP